MTRYPCASRYRITPWLGRSGRGEAPTRAIVRASARICSGVLTREDVPREAILNAMSARIRVAGRPSYGRSLIVDPWGTVLAQAPDEETVVVADLDRTRLEVVRANLSSLAHRRPTAYRWPVEA
jgi:predicted amidohydrolase